MANSDSFLDELVFKSRLESTSSELTEHDKSALELLEMLIKEELTKIKDVACQTEDVNVEEKKSVGADLKVEKKVYGDQFGNSAFVKIQILKPKLNYKLRRAPWKKYRAKKFSRVAKIVSKSTKNEASFDDKTTLKSFSSYTSEDRTNFEFSNPKLIPYHSRNTLTDVSWAKTFNSSPLERSQSEGNYLKSSSMKKLHKRWKNVPGINIHAYNVETFTDDPEDELIPKTRPMIIRKEPRKNRKSFFYKNSNEDEEKTEVEVVNLKIVGDSVHKPSAPSLSEFRRPSPNVSKSKLTLTEPKSAKTVLILKGDSECPIESLKIDKDTVRELRNELLSKTEEVDESGKIKVPACSQASGEGVYLEKIFITSSPSKLNETIPNEDLSKNEISNEESYIKIVFEIESNDESLKKAEPSKKYKQSSNEEIIPSVEYMDTTSHIEESINDVPINTDDTKIEPTDKISLEALKDIAPYKEPLTEDPVYISKEEISTIETTSNIVVPNGSNTETSKVASIKEGPNDETLKVEIKDSKLRIETKEFFEKVDLSKDSSSSSDLLSEICNLKKPRVPRIFEEVKNSKSLIEKCHSETLSDVISEMCKSTNPITTMHFRQEERKMISHSVGGKTLLLPAPEHVKVPVSDHYTNPPPPPERAPVTRQVQSEHNLDLRQIVASQQPLFGSQNRLELKQENEETEETEEKEEDSAVTEQPKETKYMKVLTPTKFRGNIRSQFKEFLDNDDVNDELLKYLKSDTTISDSTERSDFKRVEEIKNLTVTLQKNFPPSILKPPPPPESYVDIKKELKNASTQMEVETEKLKSFSTKSCGRSGLILKPEVISERSQFSKSGLFLNGKSELDPPKAAVRDKSYFSGSFWDEKHPLGKYRGNSNLGLLGLKNPKGNLTDNTTNMFVPHDNSELKIKNRTSKNLLKQLQNIKLEKTMTYSDFSINENHQNENKIPKKIGKTAFNIPSTSQGRTLVSKGTNKLPNSSDSDKTEHTNTEETSSENTKVTESDDSSSTDKSNVYCEDLIPTPSIETGNWPETGDHRNSILSWQSHDISRPRNRKESPKGPKTKNEHLKNKQSIQNRNFNQISRKKEFLIDPDMFKEVLSHVRRMREKYSNMVEEAFGKSTEFGKITSFTYPVFPSYDKDEELKDSEDPEDHKTREDPGKTERSSKSPDGTKTPERNDKLMDGPSKSDRFSKTPERHDKEGPSKSDRFSKTPERHDKEGPSKSDRFSKTPERHEKEGPSKIERSKSNESTFEADKEAEDIGYEKRKDIFYKFLKMMMKKVKEIEENEALAESPSVAAKTEKKVSFPNMNEGGRSVKLDSAVQTSNRNSNKNVQTDTSKKKIPKKKNSSESLIVAKKPVFRPNSFKSPMSSKSFHSRMDSKRASTKSSDGRRPSSKTLSVIERNPGSPRKSDINITNIKLGNEDIVMRKKPNEAVIILGESGKKESVKISITTQGHEAEKTKNKVSIDDVLMHIEDKIMERFKTQKARRSPYRETKSSVLKKASPSPDLSSKSRKSSSRKDSDSSKTASSRKDKKTESDRSSYSSRKDKKSFDSSSYRPKSRFNSKDKRSSTQDSKTKSDRSKSSDRKSAERSRLKKESRSKSPDRSSRTAKSTTDSLKSSLKKSGKKSDLSRLYVLATPKTRDGLAKSPRKTESSRQKSATTSAEIAELSEDSTVVSEKSVRSKYKLIERNPTKYFPRVISPPGRSLDLPKVPEEDHSEDRGAGLMKIAEPLNHARMKDVLINGHRVVDERQLKNAISAHVPVEIVDKRKKALPNSKLLSYYEPEKAKDEKKKPALKVKRKFIRPKIEKPKESTTVNLTELIEKLALLEKAEKLLRMKENGKKSWKY